MLVNAIDVIEFNAGFAPAINVPSLTAIRAVIDAAELENVGVILQHAQSHENWMSRSEAVSIMRYYANKSNVPVAVHFDHGETPEDCLRAMELGFTSVMYDGSRLTFNENVHNTRTVVEASSRYGVSVEAELGAMPDADKISEDILLTSVKQAQEFVRLTNVDMLAVSIGTAHGYYKQDPKINYERITDLRNAISRPLVMHGGSGLKKTDYQKAIKSGIKKINYFTYMSKSPLELIQKENFEYFEELEETSRNKMMENARQFIKIMKEV